MKKLALIRRTYINLHYLYDGTLPSVVVTLDKKFRVNNNDVKITELNMMALIAKLTEKLLDNKKYD